MLCVCFSLHLVIWAMDPERVTLQIRERVVTGREKGRRIRAGENKHKRVPARLSCKYAMTSVEK